MSARTVSRPGDSSTGTMQPASVASLAGLVVVATSTLLMLQSMRVFVTYLVFVIDQSNRTSLAMIATGVFLASGLGWFLIRVAGIRPSVLGAAGVLAISRFTLQFWTTPEARLWLAAVAFIAWGWLIFALLVTRRETVALGISLGLALDLGIRIVFETVDTPWIPSFSSNLVTSIVTALMLGVLSLVELPDQPLTWNVRSSLSLIVIGPAFALYQLVTGNLGFAQAHLLLDFPGAAVVLSLGMAIGVLVAALRWSGEIAAPTGSVGRLLWRVGLVVGVAGGFWWFWSVQDSSVFGLIVCTAAMVILLTEVLLADSRTSTGSGSGLAAVCFALGLLLEAGLLFGYYTLSGSRAFLFAIVVIFLLASLAGAARPAMRTRERGFPIVVIAGLIGGVLLMVSGWEVWSWNDALAGSTIGPDITVMTYNIQNGFSANERFDLPQIAQVIQDQHPDVVVLQEVSRGWLVTSGIDEVLWLSQRLHMNYAFGANSDDGMWGNVVLTRGQIGSVNKVQYDVTENLKRSVLQVELSTQGGDLWVLATHLDDPRDAGAIRLKQTDELIAAWDHQSPALLMGDLNSDPRDPVITTIQSAGFVDFGRDLGASDTTSHDGRRIDYIFGTRDISLADIRVPNVWTSDHRPVVARISLLPIQSRRSMPVITVSPDGG